MKQMSRRGLFGVAAGSAVAGPSAVKSVLASVPATPPQPYYGGLNTVGTAYVPTVGDLTRDLKECLGQKDDIATRAMSHERYHAEGLTIDGLRSISAANRARMIAEANARRSKAEELSYVDRRIAELKKKLGILGHLV